MLVMAMSMLKAKGMPGWLWGEAVLTAVFILNRSPTRSVEGKNDIHASEGISTPYLGTNAKTRPSRARDMATKLREI
jgi:hypothetical protein